MHSGKFYSSQTFWH